EHHAFCTRGCFEGFYRNRCRVCERDLRKTGKLGEARRLYCRPPRRCAAEAQKWPEKYGGGQWGRFYGDEAQKCPFHGPQNRPRRRPTPIQVSHPPPLGR